jgi:pimeloyl-ACP methyl ester carboxylesterase
MASSPRTVRGFSRKLSNLNLSAAGLPTTSPQLNKTFAFSPLSQRAAATATAAAGHRSRFFHSSSLSGGAGAFRSAAKPLQTKVLAEGSSPHEVAYILHGLLGSQRNFASWAKAFTQKTNVGSIGVDLRGHGNSGAEYPPPHTLDSASGDLLATARALDRWPSVLIGHSMGGKVLLNALATPAIVDELLQKAPGHSLDVFVLDSYPGTKTHNADIEGHPRHPASAGAGSGSPSPSAVKLDGVETVLSIVASAPFPIPSRQWVADKCAAHGLDKATSMWLASNLTSLDAGASTPAHAHSSGGVPHSHKAGSASPGFKWLFDPHIASCLFNDYLKVDLWPLLTNNPPSKEENSGRRMTVPKGVNLHMVTATRSSRWKDKETQALIERSKEAFSSAPLASYEEPPQHGQVHWLPIEAGHWVHADNPHGLLALVDKALKEAKEERERREEGM